jgi:uncharacterized protein
MMRLLHALLIGAAIAVVAMGAPALCGMSAGGWLPSSLLTHSIMLAASLVIMAIIPKGAIAEYGFRRGSFRMTPSISLWMLPTAVLSVLQFMASRAGSPVQDVMPLSKPQFVVFVWIYASVAEEIFVRGLLQGYLGPLAGCRISCCGKTLSVPVVFCAVFFGGMHVVLWPMMGALALVPMGLATVLGLVTGYYRAKTGSLLPAILIHALFNIGGSLPAWILGAAGI